MGGMSYTPTPSLQQPIADDNASQRNILAPNVNEKNNTIRVWTNPKYSYQTSLSDHKQPDTIAPTMRWYHSQATFTQKL